MTAVCSMWQDSQGLAGWESQVIPGKCESRPPLDRHGAQPPKSHQHLLIFINI